MSTTVTFASTHEKGFRAEPTSRIVRIFGAATTYVRDSCDSGDPIHVHDFAHGLERTENCPDEETDERPTEDAVVVDNRIGEACLPVTYVSARIDRAARSVTAS